MQAPRDGIRPPPRGYADRLGIHTVEITTPAVSLYPLGLKISRGLTWLAVFAMMKSQAM